MGATQDKPKGPDFAQGVAASEIPEGATLAGRSGDTAILVSHFGADWFAISATCTHYGAPLADGLCKDGAARCPWHHARFDLRTGEAIAAPAIDAQDRWRVSLEGERVIVREKLAPASPTKRASVQPKRIVIVGGGAAGFAAAEMLRRRGYEGALTMLSADSAAPCDRPNLSKDYLVGSAPAEWMPLRGEDFYRDNKIDLRLNVSVKSIDPGARNVTAETGEAFAYDALLLATGAEPIRLPTPGFDRANVYTLRSMADSDAIIAAAKSAKRVAVIGASFIGLEAAASLLHRGLEVHVVAPEDVPMKKVLGAELGAHVQNLHVDKGVRFHLGLTGTNFDGSTLTLSNGETLQVDFIVQGVGVRPRTTLAEAAGLKTDKGVLVDHYLQTSAPGIYAAGDIARFPHGAETMRVEHWVVAERQGQIAALNMLGEPTPYHDAPFFWSAHYDLSIRYSGHAESWDNIDIDGDIAKEDATLRYIKNGKALAIVTLGRDLECLKGEAELESAA